VEEDEGEEGHERMEGGTPPRARGGGGRPGRRVDRAAAGMGIGGVTKPFRDQWTRACIWNRTGDGGCGFLCPFGPTLTATRIDRLTGATSDTRGGGRGGSAGGCVGDDPIVPWEQRRGGGRHRWAATRGMPTDGHGPPFTHQSEDLD